MNILLYKEMMEKLRTILQPVEVQQEDHVHLLFYAVVTNCVQKVKEILDVLPDQVKKISTCQFQNVFFLQLLFSLFFLESCRM